METGLLQFAIPRRMDFRLPPRQHLGWCDIADCAVKADGIVMVHVAAARRQASTAYPDGCILF